jgi:hypothetical protein
MRNDAIRILPFVVLLGTFWFGDLDGFLTVIIGVGMATAYALFSHATRRILFPYLDLQKFANAALGNPTGAGLVFLGVCILLGCLILGMALGVS